MLKGCQREMIVLQTQSSPLFESAYFVLRRECRGAGRCDLLAEANRIIQGEKGSGLWGRRRPWRAVLWFLLGFLVGGGIFAIVRFLFGF